MRRTQRGEVLVAQEIPLDLQFEIIKRLPVKSLARFKCVSKLWSSLIHSQGYLFPSPPRLFISFIRHNPLKTVLLSLASTSKDTDLHMMIDGIGEYLIAALCGLILYRFCGRASIYNPTTRQRVTLPPVINLLAEKKHMPEHNYFFGYDSVLDQYKVVCTYVVWSVKFQRTYAHHWVFVLETGSSWKRIEFDHPHFPVSQGLCINGVIYYLAHSDVSGENIIIIFDIRSEEFNIIQLPHPVSEYVKISEYLDIIEYGGKPTIFDCINLRYSLVNLWILEDVGKWSNTSLVLQPCQMHFFPNNIRFKVIGTTQNGEVILKPVRMSSRYYFLYYDLHKNDVRRVNIRGISEKTFELALMEGENIMHFENLNALLLIFLLQEVLSLFVMNLFTS